MNFSFFFGQGGAGACRGRQMAQKLGGKINPKIDYRDDICIFVKKILQDRLPLPTHSYLDVNDSPRAYEYIRDHPDTKIGIIADSGIIYKFLKKELKRNDIYLIKHHHCNFERWVRPDRPVKTVGIMGSIIAFQYPLDKIRRDLKIIGLELKYEPDYWAFYKDKREKVVKFYKNIDIQIAWRPKAWSPRFEPFRRPLKLINAGSFGIPTVAYPEPSYVDEFDGYYLPALKIDQLIESVKKLKDYPGFYKVIVDRAIKKSEEYHIDNISKLYLNLK